MHERVSQTWLHVFDYAQPTLDLLPLLIALGSAHASVQLSASAWDDRGWQGTDVRYAALSAAAIKRE